MPGLGAAEIICIFLLILVLFGPQELPHLARLILRLINEMKNLFYRLEACWKNEKSLFPENPATGNGLSRKRDKKNRKFIS